MGGQIREMEITLLWVKCGNRRNNERLLNGFDKVD